MLHLCTIRLPQHYKYLKLLIKFAVQTYWYTVYLFNTSAHNARQRQTSAKYLLQPFKYSK